MRKIVLDADFEISRNPAAGRSLIAGVFTETNEDGLTTVKNSGSTFENIDISNNANASYIHDLIFDGTVSIKILGNGGEAITLQSDILTAPHLTFVESLITGNMDSVNGYDINEYQLIYKLIVWEYITPTYIKTMKPYVVYNDVNNSNDATTALSYEMPITKITANKGAMAITSDPLAIVWSDGTVVDCDGVDAERTGAGVGFVYLIGNYSRLVASNQGISVIDFFSNNLTDLFLASNSALNIQNSHFNNVLSLNKINLLNCSNSKVDSVLSKFNMIDIFLNNTLSKVENPHLVTSLLLENIFVANTVSNFTDVALDNKLNLEKVNMQNSDCQLSADNLLFEKTQLIDLNISAISTNANFKFAPSINVLTIFGNGGFLNDSNGIFNDLIKITGFNNENVTITDTKISTFSNIQKIDLSNTNATINTASITNKSNLVELIVLNITGQITSVNAATRIINVAGLSNQTVTSNNSLIQDLVNRTRTGIRQLTYDFDAGLDQSNLDILEARGWELVAIV